MRTGLVVIVGGVVAVAIIAIVVGSEILSDQLQTRTALEREQRKREDAARKYQQDIENRNFWVDVGATIADPIGLFH